MNKLLLSQLHVSGDVELSDGYAVGAESGVLRHRIPNNHSFTLYAHDTPLLTLTSDQLLLSSTALIHEDRLIASTLPHIHSLPVTVSSTVFPPQWLTDLTNVSVSYTGTDVVYGFDVTDTLYTIRVKQDTTFRVWMVAGGGAGGGGQASAGGGGGAGGYVAVASHVFEVGKIYHAWVGVGGTPILNYLTTRLSPENNGGDTELYESTGEWSFRAIGGGAGSYTNGFGAYFTGAGLGGSGGGGSAQTSGKTSNGVLGMPGQGNQGGNGFLSDTDDNLQTGGGGGGGSTAGVNGASSVAGNGGTGVASDITGVSTYYAGGGGGGKRTTSGTAGTGGLGGGGNGSKDSDGGNGVAGTGGGGGGGGDAGIDASSFSRGGYGGAGILFLRTAYPNTAVREWVWFTSTYTPTHAPSRTRLQLDADYTVSWYANAVQENEWVAVQCLRDGVVIFEKRQYWNDNGFTGSGTRSSTILPLETTFSTATLDPVGLTFRIVFSSNNNEYVHIRSESACLVLTEVE